MEIDMQLPNDPGQVSSPDDIVITGMSGTFSGSHNIDEFEYKLYNKIDMVEKETRFEFRYAGQPERGGIIPEINKFDCGFFGVHGREAEFMDPLLRMMLEKCAEAIFDAGLHPEDLKNTRTGVYVGSCASEYPIVLSRQQLPEKSFFWTGNMSNVTASRISYFFNLRGPSFVVDTACSSSLFALEHAYSAMRRGEIDSALVGGTNLCMFAGETIQFEKLGVLSRDGACKTFDEKANGYVRAEGICALLLQKHKDAKRIYCSVVHAKTNSDGYKEEGITYPSGKSQTELLEEFYTECGIPPNYLSYLEAHGTGTKVGDPQECFAVDHVFTKNRDQPLLIGSVKSSVGHSEPVSGCISIVKSILALEKGKISPNIHFYSPNPTITSIVEGRLKVVTDVTNFEDDRALIGINNFGFGGANCHVLVKGNMKLKQSNGIPQDNLPRLVCLSGRNKESVRVLCDYVAEIGIDSEFIGLLHNIFRKNIANHLYRGYIIISKDGVMDTSIHNEEFVSWETPPLTVVFGVFENWYTLLENFLELQFFSDTLERIQKILIPVKLECTVLSASIEIRESYNILGSIITQICIADLTKTLKISPNFTAGYSFGEFVCAYFDGALKLEEALECASIANTEFVKQMKNNKYVLNGTPNRLGGNEDSSLRSTLVEKFSVVLKKPKHWRQQLASAEYFAGALLESNANHLKRFHKLDSVILEIGKNDIDISSDDCENRKLMIIPETFVGFLKTLGRLYQLGYNLDIQKLYPTVKFPVSRGTPRISSKIKWTHHKVYGFKDMAKKLFHFKSFTIDLRKTEWSYISGHMIDGRILFPASGYLILTWEVLAEKYKVQDSLPVIFENVRFIRGTTIQPSTAVTFVVVISSSGYFEITEKDSIVVTGHIKEILNERSAYHNFRKPVTTEHEMTSKDIYQELRLRGYHYQGHFRALKKCDITGVEAEIEWSNNYITFIDNLFQLQILGHDIRLLYVPTYIDKLTILPVLHLQFVKLPGIEEDSVTLPAYCNPHSGILRSGGIEVQGLMATPIPRRKELSVPVLEVNEFVPNETKLSKQLSIKVNLQIIIENSSVVKSIPSLEIVDPTSSPEPENRLLTPGIIEALEDIPLVQAKSKVFSSAPMSINDVEVEDGNLRSEAGVYMLIIGSRLLEKKQVLEDVLYALQNNGFIISRESNNFTAEDLKHPDLVLLTVHRNEDEIIIMMSKKHEKIPVFIKLDEDKEFSWLPELQSILKSNSDVVLYSEHNPLSGITGFFNCLQKEPDVGNVRAVFIIDEGKSFNAEDKTFHEQLSKNLAMNIYKNGQWGTYRHLPLNTKEEIESQHIFLGQLTTGDFSSLKWVQGPLDYATEISSDEELVEVHYSSLNFKDVMLASGKITPDSVIGYSRNQLCDLGMEFAGVNQKGKRIMGITACGGLGTRLTAKDFLTWEIPDDWSLEDAATVPVVYTTMLYGLRMRGNMKKGESILIHSGLGGVGQAAIRYCLFHGQTVFTTVGSDERKELLKKLFPQLTDNRIGNSHDTSFQQLIMRETKGRGVDLVLNSLAGEKLLASVECLAQGGRMIEIGKYDIRANNMLNLRLFKKEASFHGVMVDLFFNYHPDILIISKLLREGIAEGSIKPLTRNVIKFNEVEQAFRSMAGGKHLGKVLIQIREESSVDNAKLNVQRYTGIPRFYCDPKKSYIIIGGLGGFGLELADWLVLRGARKLVLSSTRGFSNGYQRMRVNVWKNYGAKIQITTSDLSTKYGCAQLIKEAGKLGPIDAIFNLAVCLRDALFENQTIDMFKESFTPKAYITMHLDQLTREMCPNLRAFVVFSSVSCGKGNAGQTNYGMANSIMERICEARRRDGYAGKAIQWGAIGEVGILGEMTENNATEINIGGTLLQKISNCFQVLDTLLLNSSPIVSSIVVAEKKRGSYSTENALEAVASIKGITDLKSVSLHSSLSEIGMDSMTAVEIKQVLETEFDIFLSPKEMKTMTLAKLQEIQDSMGSRQSSVANESVHENEVQLTLFKWVVDESESQNLDIRMNSKVAEFENAPTILVIPGIEGFMKCMEPLCENLEADVHGLQFNYAEAPETILDMAKTKLPLVEKYLSKNKPFQMIAYSYGVVEALELVGLLEAKGYIGTVYCIDGAPAVMQHFVKLLLGKTVDDTESYSIMEILKAFNIPLSGLRKIALEYRKCKNIEEKVDKTLEVYGNQIPISNEYMGKLIKGGVKRLLALVAYKPTYTTLESRLVLFKPTQPTFQHRFEHFGLEEICKNPIFVHTIEGNHNSILSNYELSKYINSYL